MSVSNDLILKRVFTKNMLKKLIYNGDNEMFSYCVRRYIRNPEGKDVRTLISEIYSYMNNEYRHEYLYKNTLLNKLLLGKHSLRTTTALTELPIGKSKADFVMINGKGTVYEIKTELDNVERLNNQIEDYYKAFRFVYVVTCEQHYNKIIDMIDENVGIIILTNKNTLKTMREAKDTTTFLDYSTIFKILRKDEFESIIKEAGYLLPIVSQFKYYKECQKLIKAIDLFSLQSYMLNKLKKRGVIYIEEFKEVVPYELKFLVYFSNFSKNDYLALNKILKYEYVG